MTVTPATENPVRNYVVAGLRVELSHALSEILDKPMEQVLKNFDRRVRRGRPGLSIDWVKEELIRLMADELSCYRIAPTEIIIGQIELKLKEAMIAHDPNSRWILAENEWHFPIYPNSVFSSAKY